MSYDLLKTLYNNIERMLTGKQRLIQPAIYRFYKERTKTYNDRRWDDGVQSAINKQYKDLLIKGKTVKINNVYISKTKIWIEDEGFVLKFDEGFINVVEEFLNIKEMTKKHDVRYNFNTFYETLLNISSLKVFNKTNYYYNFQHKQFGEETFMVNGLKIHLKRESNRIYINGIFVRIDDVIRILYRAICYTDLEEYKRFIKDVSYIGMDWKHLIGSGVSLQIFNPLDEVIVNNITGQTKESLNIRFSLLWDSDRRRDVYLILNGEKYLIRYKGVFKKQFNYPHRVITIRDLKEHLKNCLDKFDNNILFEIIDNGIKEAEIIKRKGEELVKATIIDVKAIAGKIIVGGGEIIGYAFTGKVSNSEYFVQENTLNVFKKMNGVWNRRCVVDDSSKQRIYEDRLANRLVNVFNEPLRIHTLHNT